MIIRLVGDDVSKVEWDLLELQGIPKPLQGETLAGKVLGQLRYTTQGGKASIQVGNTLLEGDVKAIPKPFVLLEKKRSAKRKREDNDTNDAEGETKRLKTEEGDATETQLDAFSDEGVEGVHYQVVGLVTRQFIMKV